MTTQDHANAVGDGLNLLLQIAAPRLCRDPSVPAFLAWIADAGPALAPALLPPAMPARAAQAQQYFRLFGHAIYAALPLPQHHFRPRRLPLPGRNDPCVCGSLRKFKQCCEVVAQGLPRLPAELGAPHVFAAMGKAAWRDLPAAKAPAHLVEAAAMQWRHEQRLKDAAALLEPWAAEPPAGARYPDTHADLLDLLGDIYADLGKPRKRRTLAQSMIDRGEPLVQSKGWQRLCLMATDARKSGEARTALAHAQRLAPDDPSVSLLEVSMLIGLGDEDRAAERAEFLAKRMERRNAEGEYDTLIAALREMGNRGAGYLRDVELSHHQDLAQLHAWLRGLPPPVLRLDLGRATAEDLGVLAETAEQRPLVAACVRAIDAGTPPLVALTPATRAWDGFDIWMPLLERHPTAADSFDVLDALMLSLQGYGSPGAEALAALVLERALGLWALLRQRYPSAACAWGFMDNRPALRLLAQHIVHDDTPTAERCFDWLRHLVETLNPQDNHGFRERLAIVLLRRGLHAEALSLTLRYPDDIDGMELARAAALWRLDRRAEAFAVLAARLRANPKLARVMQSPDMPRPKPADFITYGTLEAARHTYASQFDLWQDPALRQLLEKPGRKL